MLAIVLRHSGQTAPEAIASLPVPVSVAVDPTAPNATEAVSAYRAAGLEVLLEGAGLPAGATPRDAEVAMAAHLAAMPEVIGLLDRRTGGFAGDRALTAQMVEILGQDGHGLLLWDEGLNSAFAIAERAGQTAALVYREVDAPEMSFRAIERGLDRAAFEAARTGETVVVATARAETLDAIRAWGEGTRAERVSAAPVSAVMLAD
ncbi:MAG: hypothetical protein GVY27_04685 [Deinococcus-Thermus bacterium]|nr:hypothetical protein [Deinococcota bacterium]